MNEKARNEAIAHASEGGRFALGNTRPPIFGELIRGIWASDSNPIRDGKYMETIRRTGRLNPGTWYRLTDGNGKFWEYQAKDTVFLTPNEQGQPGREPT